MLVFPLFLFLFFATAVAIVMNEDQGDSFVMEIAS
jgi:hypothetical protein